MIFLNFVVPARLPLFFRKNNYFRPSEARRHPIFQSMFLRTNKRFKYDKEHRYGSVVENRRVTGGGSVQKRNKLTRDELLLALEKAKAAIRGDTRTFRSASPLFAERSSCAMRVAL